MKHSRAQPSVLSSRVFIRKSLSLRSHFWAALLVLTLATPALAEPRRGFPFSRNDRAPALPLSAHRASHFEVLPLERSGQNLLLLRGFINGKPALLAVDTGAHISAISLDRVAHFGMTPAPSGSEIPTRIRINGHYSGIKMARSLRLGALNLIDEPMVAMDLGGSARAAEMMDEEAIDGVIGADILFPTNAVLDCLGQRLVLKTDPRVRGGIPGLDYHGFTRVKMHVSGKNLYVNARFNGRRAKLMVDTGAFGTLVHQPFVRSMKIPMRASDFVSAGVNLQKRDLKLATISRLSVGSVNLRNKEVNVVDLEDLFQEELLDARRPVAGLLGSEILQRHNAIIDFGTRTLYLKR